MKIVFTHKLEDIISLDNLLLAWEEFLIGKRSKKDVQLFNYNLMDNILSLYSDLVNKTYKHGIYHSFRINDPKRRHIHKAKVRDRLLHHAIYRMLYPFFDRTFIPNSFSCRLNKGTHKALNQFRKIAYKASKNHTKTCWVLKCDIKKFFANIDHEILLNILREYLRDENIIWLLDEVIGSFNTKHYSRKDKNYHLDSRRSFNPEELRGGNNNNGIGLPLGNLTSQLFSNIYMNEFDYFIKHKLKIKYYIRYADDFVILSDNKNYLKNLISKIRGFLQKELKLSLHPNKIILKTFSSGVDFLGWVHFKDHRVLRKTTKKRMFRKLKCNSKEETLQSYLGLLEHGNSWKIINRINLDYWLENNNFSCKRN